jgi:serine/threonine-protein kinase RsbW
VRWTDVESAVGCITGPAAAQREPHLPKCYIRRAMSASRTAVVPASAAGVRLAAEALDAFAAAASGRVPSDALRSVQVALDEVLSNIVQHAYRGRGEGCIQIAFRLAEGDLEVKIQDDAPPFDPLAAAVPDLTAGLADRRIGGLGILLTRRLMDDVRYERTDGGNRLTLRKRTNAAGVAPPGERP